MDIGSFKNQAIYCSLSVYSGFFFCFVLQMKQNFSFVFSLQKPFPSFHLAEVHTWRLLPHPPKSSLIHSYSPQVFPYWCSYFLGLWSRHLHMVWCSHLLSYQTVHCSFTMVCTTEYWILRPNTPTQNRNVSFLYVTVWWFTVFATWLRQFRICHKPEKPST